MNKYWEKRILVREQCKQEHARDKETQGSGAAAVIPSTKERPSAGEMWLLGGMQSDLGSLTGRPCGEVGRLACISASGARSGWQASGEGTFSIRAGCN